MASLVRTRVLLLSSLCALSTSAGAQSLEESLKHFQAIYPLQSPLQKLIGPDGTVSKEIQGVNRLQLANDLRGTRNFRVVLSGFMYRGGKLNPNDTRRDNRNPLPDFALENLCKQGFGQAVYLYDKRMSEKERTITCTVAGVSKKLLYSKIPPLGSRQNTTRILNMLHAGLSSAGHDHSPVYTHCWNGWHASGYISAVALRQFCDVSAEQAVAYWNLNTDHVCRGKGYDEVRRKIRAFQKLPNREILKETQDAVCPKISFRVDEGTWCTRG